MIGRVISPRYLSTDRETKSRRESGTSLLYSSKFRKTKKSEERREIFVSFSLLLLSLSLSFNTRLRANVRNNRIYTPTPLSYPLRSFCTFLGYNDIPSAWYVTVAYLATGAYILTRHNRRSVRSSGKSDVTLSLFQPISSLLWAKA